MSSFDPSTIAIVTDTFYPNSEEKGSSDAIRSALALKTAERATSYGFRTIVVDGGSSPEFLKKLKKTGARIFTQKVRGMSAGRQQGYQLAFDNLRINQCLRIEPEKWPLIDFEWIKKASALLSRNADIIIPSRKDQGWESLPSDQRASETLGNQMYYDLLSAYQIMNYGRPYDVFFGPRFFTREAWPIFMKQYIFNSNPNVDAHKHINPGTYSNALFFPITYALCAGLKVVGVETDYVHPKEQTEFEEGKPEFATKRITQRHGITLEHIELLRLLHGEPSLLQIKT